MSVDPAGQFLLTGGTLSVTSIQGSLTNQGGTLAPGTSPGSTMITGDYIQQSGTTLAIEIGGATQGVDFDFVNVGGTATLAGTLDVSLLGGFTPVAGEEITILTAGTIINNGLVLGGPAGAAFNLLVGPTSVLLQAPTPGLSGDFNDDGLVDAADYVVWRKNGGTQEEFTLWRSNFGNTLGSGAGSGSLAPLPAPTSNPAVPEPAAIALLTIGFGILRLVRIRRRHSIG